MNYENLPEEIEYWHESRIAKAREDGPYITDSAVEAFVHPGTGTAARIIQGANSYSVQPVMGDFGPYDNVVQPDDPSELLSGWSSVVALEVETLENARLIAHAWIKGWYQRAEATGSEPGDIQE